MHFLIVSTKKDLSYPGMIKEFTVLGIKVNGLFYEDLDVKKLKKEDYQNYDYCILRDPYNTGEDFSSVLDVLKEFFPINKLLDSKVYNKYPEYEDKLFQHKLFKPIKMPKYSYYNKENYVKISKFPVIVKKRISSRGKGVFVIRSKEEINKFLKTHPVEDYIFEEYIEPVKDIRVLIIGNKVIGAVNRKPRLKKREEYKGIGVKVKDEFKISEYLKKKSIEVSKLINCDFCGIDFIIDSKNQEYLLECNISPQFDSFEKALKINVSRLLVDYIVRK